MGGLCRHEVAKTGPAVSSPCMSPRPCKANGTTSEVVAQVLDELPPDPTDREDMVHSAFFLGKPIQALSESVHLDGWLAAHLVDLMEAIELIDSEPDE